MKAIQAALYLTNILKVPQKLQFEFGVFEFLNSLVSAAAFPSLQAKINRLREETEQDHNMFCRP